jgi:hypothetical protein
MGSQFDFQAASQILKQRYSQQSINASAFQNNALLQSIGPPPIIICPHGKKLHGEDHCWEIECVAEAIHES